MNEDKIAHLNMIQSVISRMAGNSALLKGWAVTLIAATFALAAKDADIRYVLIAYIPAVAFWILDAYYLRQERLFRDLYNHVRTLDSDKVDFSMDTSGFSRPAQNAFFAFVNLIFYGFLIGVILLVMFAFKPTGGA
ncbi:hypothetical protein EC9_37100 [Rosistilla ulvae]|uniref:Uncharacterized protein n=1 Tax=Rosistilla ulvae TaxID=1930277 RepID=A0A517M3R8_9BACT|nr:hypothetical protein [Rosistilla ulvae]QDS89510.1 hypothetical protein EC9_37100 [Rosistilla ulvae]